MTERNFGVDEEPTQRPEQLRFNEIIRLAERIEREQLSRTGPTSEEFWTMRAIGAVGRMAEEHARVLHGERRNAELGQEWADAVLALVSVAEMYLEPADMEDALRRAPDVFRTRSKQ